MTGSFIFIFLVTHWATFWYKFNFEQPESYYQVVLGNEVGFGNMFFSVLQHALRLVGPSCPIGFAKLIGIDSPHWPQDVHKLCQEYILVAEESIIVAQEYILEAQ